MAFDVLRAALAEGRADPGAFALAGPEVRWSFAELDAEVDRRAERIAAVGRPGPGGVRIVAVEPDASGIVELFATWRAGLAVAPLNARLTEPERRTAHAVLAGAEVDAYAGAQAVLWTSGTSGTPRGVALGWDGLRASAEATRERLALGGGDVWLASLSPAHVGGLALLTRAVWLGCGLLAPGRFDAEAAWDAIRGRAPGPGGQLPAATHASLVPTQLAHLLDRARGQAPPTGFRCALLGGSATPAQLLERAHAAGWPLALTYGLTEMTSQVATAPPALVERKPGTVGPPLAGVEIRVGEGGELLARGTTRALGYVGSAEPLVDADGWHRTGDLGRIDADGDLWITGRADDRIVTGGVNVDPAEVEGVLRGHPGVWEVAVVGVPDPEWGEVVGAWVVPVEGELDEAELDAFARTRLSGPKRPRLVRFGSEVPRNANGKTDRARVRALFARGGGNDEPRAGAHSGEG